MVSVVKLAYKDAVEAWLGAKTISRSWAESPCTCAKFNEIPEMDGPTDTHKPVEMRCEISCLVLRCSAIKGVLLFTRGARSDRVEQTHSLYLLSHDSE